VAFGIATLYALKFRGQYPLMHYASTGCRYAPT
jgi:hypothetical protein